MIQSAVLTGTNHKLTSPIVSFLISPNHPAKLTTLPFVWVTLSRLYLQLDKMSLKHRDSVLVYL